MRKDILREYIREQLRGGKEEELLRRFVRETNRPDARPLNEGVLQFLGKIFKGLLGLIGLQLKDESKQYYAVAVDGAGKAIQAAGLTDAENWGDLDPNNPEHAKVIQGTVKASMSEALDGLSEALEGMMDVPPLPEKPGLEEQDKDPTEIWKQSEEKMKTAAGALGKLLGVTKFIGEKYPEFKAAHDQAMANPPTAPVDVFYQAGGLAQLMLDSDFVKETAAPREEAPAAEEEEPAKTVWDELDEAELRSQNPVVIGAALLLMPEDKAIKFISSDDLDPSTRTEIIQKTAPIKKIPADVMKDLGDTLGLDLPGEDQQIDGPKLVVKLLKGMGQQKETSVFDDLQGRDMELADHLRGQMFVFGDLMKVQEREVQLVLRQLDASTLAPAMADGKLPDGFKEFIFQNMGSKKQLEIEDRLKKKDEFSAADIADAQNKIVVITLNLAEEGKVNTRPDAGE